MDASFDEQSVNLPGNELTSSALFRLVNSRAFFAASRALEAIKPLSTIFRPTVGFSAKNREKLSEKSESVIVRASLLPSFVFVWPSNCGSGILTEMIAVKPSRTSSPLKLGSFSLNRLFLRA